MPASASLSHQVVSHPLLFCVLSVLCGTPSLAPSSHSAVPSSLSIRFGNASSPRPPLIMLAGFGGTVSAWPRDLLEALAAGQEVILVDNRGQGNTIVSSLQ